MNVFYTLGGANFGIGMTMCLTAEINGPGWPLVVVLGLALIGFAFGVGQSHD